MSEESLSVDCAVLGFGIAAVGSALELASQGRSTIVICYGKDSVCLRSLVTVLPTPLARQQTRGYEFEQIAVNALKSAGVVLAEGFFLTVTRSKAFELRFEDGGPFRHITLKTDRIIFAPAGTDPIVGMRPDLRDYYGGSSAGTVGW